MDSSSAKEITKTFTTGMTGWALTAEDIDWVAQCTGLEVDVPEVELSVCMGTVEVSP